jgi:hypothetical protein
MRAIFAVLGLFAFGSIGLAGCDDDEDSLTFVSGGTNGEGAQAGAGGKGDAASGGKGGSNSAGSSAKGGKGGSGTGGSGTGGSGTGGSGTGGSGTGGSGTGGSDNGGAGAGGADNGGAGAGGSDTGGAGAGAEGGTGGSGGSGGTDTTGGTSGSGGTSGAGGTAGSSGAGGTAGSSGGSIGASGSAGEGGESGAGASSGAGGTGGIGGTGGATPPSATATACSYGCVDDGDCDVAQDIFCDTNLGRCKQPNLGCETHADCVPFASAWSPGTCTADDDCPNFFFGDVCVKLQGVGRCAITPYPDCSAFGGVPTVLEHFSPTEDITVCVNSSGRCENNTCFLGCTDTPDFCTDGSTGFGPVCDSVSGRCGGCTDDDECDGAGVSHCNLATGFCECAGAGDCVGLPGRDACVNGACGCSGTSVCTALASPAATFCE